MNVYRRAELAERCGRIDPDVLERQPHKHLPYLMLRKVFGADSCIVNLMSFGPSNTDCFSNCAHRVGCVV